MEKVVSKAAQHRHSPLAYADQPISSEHLSQLLKTFQWAPSAFNEQPWRIILGIKGQGDTYDKILGTLAEFNQLWAQQAPVLLIVSAKTHFTQFERPNDHATYDTGQAMGSMAIQAAALDLHMHQMGGFSAEAAREIFQIPEGFQPMAAAAIGHLGGEDRLHPSLEARAKAPRTRKDLSEIVFTGNWGEGFAQ